MKDTPARRPIERRPVGAKEFAHYLKNPGNPQAERRFALHVLSRHPGDVWATSTMALHEETDAGFEKKIRLAIKTGLRAMTARLIPGDDIVIQGDREGESTLMAMRLYANHLALRGRVEDAREILRIMLEVDPSDTVEAIPMLERKGIVVGAGMDARMN